MNEYTTEQLAKIRELAQKLTPISDIAVLMELDVRQFRMDIADDMHPASLAYHRGKAETALKIRENELTLAEAGSPLAVTLMNSYIKDMETDEDL